MVSHKTVTNLFCILILFIASFSVGAETKRFLDGDLSLSGSFEQGSMLQGLISGKFLDGYSLVLDSKNVRVTGDGRFILGFGRDASTKQQLHLVKGTSSYSVEIALAKRNYNTQSITGVPQKTVTPSEDKLARIRQETALVKEARRTDSDLVYFLAEFQPPIDAQITGVYGSQRIYNGTPKRPHYGIDYAGPMGALVFAPADAEVTLVHQDMYYSGGTLIVDHGYGVSSTFIHLSEILVEEGQKIKQGDPIAKVGSGGRSTGPHLDWRVNWYQERVDPLLVLKKNK